MGRACVWSFVFTCGRKNNKHSLQSLEALEKPILQKKKKCVRVFEDRNFQYF